LHHKHHVTIGNVFDTQVSRVGTPRAHDWQH
jgi:hypothetical protein